MINFELYRIFIIVADEKNITKASEKLHISQPAVTKHIKNLEKTMGVTLFKRNNKGINLTPAGQELYNKLKEPIDEIMKIDDEANKNKNINIGSHNHLLNIMFGESINKFYIQHPEINVNLQCLETPEMIRMLENKELDVVFSKEVENIHTNNIKYIQLGVLNDIFIVNKKSKLANKKLSKKDLEQSIIYLPRKYAQTTTRLNNMINNNNLRNSSYNTILEVISKSDAIGLITKEYINKDALEKYNIVQLETELKLEPIKFGIYFNEEESQEVRYLIKIIKEQFKINN